MSLYKRANSKFWWLKYMFEGELIQKSTKCTNKQKAELFAAKDLLDRNAGVPTKREAAPTFETACADFLEWSELNHAQKPNSFRRVQFSAKPLQTFFGKTKVDRIERKDVEKFLLWRSKQISRKTKEKISGDTINLEMIVLKTIFRRLADADVILKSPAAGVKLLAKNARKFYVVPAEEEKVYLMACPQPLRDVAAVMLETGMRPSEVYNLTRDNISIEKGFLKIENGKTASSNRRIWLPEKSSSILEARLKKFTGKFVFPKGDDDISDAPTYQLNEQHRETLERVGLKFRLYDLRHTFATRILEDGKTDLLTLASLLGHNSLDQVMRYAHPSEQRKADAVKNLQAKAV